MSKMAKHTEGTKSTTIDSSYAKFYKAVYGQNRRVMSILNTHLLAEYYMDQMILAVTPNGKILFDEARLTFWQKLILVRALNLIDDTAVRGLKALNSVRNSCTHKADYRVNNKDIDLIGSPFGKLYSDIKKKYPKVRLDHVLALVTASLDNAYEDALKHVSETN